MEYGTNFNPLLPPPPPLGANCFRKRSSADQNSRMSGICRRAIHRVRGEMTLARWSRSDDYQSIYLSIGLTICVSHRRAPWRVAPVPVRMPSRRLPRDPDRHWPAPACESLRSPAPPASDPDRAPADGRRRLNRPGIGWVRVGLRRRHRTSSSKEGDVKGKKSSAMRCSVSPKRWRASPDSNRCRSAETNR